MRNRLLHRWRRRIFESPKCRLGQLIRRDPLARRAPTIARADVPIIRSARDRWTPSCARPAITPDCHASPTGSPPPRINALPRVWPAGYANESWTSKSDVKVMPLSHGRSLPRDGSDGASQRSLSLHEVVGLLRDKMAPDKDVINHQRLSENTASRVVA
jgi:hypothetical protein